MKFVSTAVLTVGTLLALNTFAETTSQQPAIYSPAQTQMDPAKNKAASEAFLAENKRKVGVTTLGNGLQYKALTTGTGVKPKPEDWVTVNYVGTFPDGREFDSSYRHGQPIKFQLNKVIQGWQDALILMPMGSTWELYIPSDLAYGEAGAPPDIGPNQALIFKVTLIDVKPQP